MMFRKMKTGILAVLIMMIALPWSNVPNVFGADKGVQARVERYKGDLGGWKEFGPIKTEKGHAIVPLRKYIDLLGLPTEYQSLSKQVVIQSVKTRLVLKLGSKTATVNGKTQVMPVPLRSVNGTLWISLDFVAKVFPAKVTKYKYGYGIELQESYVIQQFGGEWFILHDQTGDLYLSPKGKYAPIKIASLDHRLNLPHLSVRKTPNGNYYVTVYEFEGDGAIFSHEIFNSLYIRNKKEVQQYSTVNYEHNFNPKIGEQIVFVKESEVLFMDDKTGKTLRSVPMSGRGLYDIQEDVWVVKYDEYELYFPETGTYKPVYEMLPSDKEKGAVKGQMTCPVSPRCGGGIQYLGREGDELVFVYKGTRITYPLETKINSSTT